MGFGAFEQSPYYLIQDFRVVKTTERQLLPKFRVVNVSSFLTLHSHQKSSRRRVPMSRKLFGRWQTHLRLERLEARDVPTFLAPARYTLGSEGADTVVGDFNGDANKDVAIALEADTVAVLLGNEQGNLGTQAYYAVEPGGQELVTADLNADGKLDLAVATYESVSVLLGTGNGTFQSQLNFSHGGISGDAIAVGDVNGDDRLDLAVASVNGFTGPDAVRILLGNGDGTFQPPIVHSVGYGGAWGVAVGDLDGDGLGDVTVDGYWGSDLHVFYGNGSYTLHHLVSPVGHTQVDVDGDGDLDIVSGKQSSQIGVMLNRGDGVLLPPTYYMAAYGWAFNPETGDLNKDGKLDVVTASSEYGTVSWVLGNGDGTFKTKETTTYADTGATHTAVADLTNDGFYDLVVATETGVSVLINDKKWAKGPRKPQGPLTDNPTGPPAPPVVPIPPPPHLRREFEVQLFSPSDGIECLTHSAETRWRVLSPARHFSAWSFSLIDEPTMGVVAESWISM